MSGPALSKHSRNSSSASSPPRSHRRHRPATHRRRIRRSGWRRSAQARQPGCGTHGAGIDLARHRLQLMNDLKGPDLGRAGHRPGRKGGPDEVTVAGLRVQTPAHVRYQMPYPWVGFGVEQAGDLDAAGHAGPAEIVPHQVDDHHVLGSVLGRLLKLAALSGGPAPQADRRLVPLMGLDIPSARSGAGKARATRWPDHRLAGAGTLRRAAAAQMRRGRTGRAGRRGIQLPAAGRYLPGISLPAGCTRPCGRRLPCARSDGTSSKSPQA